MKKLAQKRIDMYDIGNGLTLMNVINKNGNNFIVSINVSFIISSIFNPRSF